MRTNTNRSCRGAVLGVLLGLLLPASLAAQTAQPEGSEWGYNKGFFWHNPQFELKISTRTQFRYSYAFTDPDSPTDSNGFFNIPRARLRLDGFAYYPWLKYKVQYDFVGDKDQCVGTGCPSNLRRPDLRDLYFDITRNPWASARLGQFKAPLGIQEMTSSGDQEFVDRARVSEEFAPSRQLGAMLFGATFQKKFAYEAGVFNGNSRNRNSNDNPGYMWVARAHFDPGGEYKLSESAVDNPDKASWTIGAAYMVNSTEQTLDEGADTLQQRTLEGFFELKYKRLFVMADYYLRGQEQLAVAADLDSDGYIAQVGVFLLPSKLEVAGRYGRLDTNDDLSGDMSTERRIALGYYISKHDLKIQSDYGQIHNEALFPPVGSPLRGLDDRTNEFRTQFQIVF